MLEILHQQMRMKLEPKQMSHSQRLKERAKQPMKRVIGENCCNQAFF